MQRFTGIASSVRSSMTRRAVFKALAFVVGWAVIAVPAAYTLFVHDTRDTIIAGHDATISPSMSGYATVDLGAYLPNMRYPTHQRLGVDVVIGKTNLDSYEALLERYALIGSHPDGEVHKVTGAVSEMLFTSALQGAVLGLAAPLLWLLVGGRRRRELVGALRDRRRVALVAACAAFAVTATTSNPWPWRSDDPQVAPQTWAPIATLVPEADIPAEARPIEVQEGLITSGTQRLIASAFDSYQTSLTFYDQAAIDARHLADRLHQPDRTETVALFVADRHDNVGMDKVTRAVGDAGGATMLFDGGDDTSTGEQWETFSLDSLAESFDDYGEKFESPGNHDNGSFVAEYLSERGFTSLVGEPVETDDGVRLLGVPDPRSSGLGSWRTASGISFADQADRLADVACEADRRGERVDTLLVHDPSLASAAVQRGCVNLVLSGHLHTQVGPDEVVGGNGKVGVTLTTGTAGGAAYAVAVGTKPRRDAQVSLITYRSGRAVGLQPVTMSTRGEFTVGAYYDMPNSRS